MLGKPRFSYKMVGQEILIKLATFEQQINQLEQQMQLIDQQVLEMQELKIALEEIEKTEEKEIYANLGKNIFIKTEIKDKKLIVEVGNRTFVKKTIPETVEIAEDQLHKLMIGKNQVMNRMQEVQQETEKVILEAQKAEHENV